MAGYRLTLKKLAKKYGVDIEGATYAKVVQEIINENVARASKKMGNLSNRRMKQAFEDSIKNGIVSLPDYAIPNITVRKGAEDGKMITDTLRDILTRGLRKAITDNPNDTEQAIAQMQSHIKDTFATYTTSHAKMIAVTEVRSSVDLSKAEYVRELISRNPNRLRVTKKWVHHDHLVKIPRPTHKAIDGEKVFFNQPFSIGLMYPHDPNAPASEVIGCQCGYQIEVEEMATNEILKELKENLKIYKNLQEEKIMKASKASINPATGKPYQIGEEKRMPDGTIKVKTSTFGWSIKGSKDANEAQKNTNKKKQESSNLKNKQIEIPKNWSPTYEQMQELHKITNIKDRKALQQKFYQEYFEYVNKKETIMPTKEVEHSNIDKTKVVNVVQSIKSATNQSFKNSVLVSSQAVGKENSENFINDWNRISRLYGATSISSMTDEQFNKMSNDINSVVSSFTNNNDIVVHNSLYKLKNTFDDIWIDGRLRTGKESGARSEKYMKERNRIEDKLLPNRKELGESGQAIYGEFCSDWQNSRASKIYDGGLHFKLKDTVRDRTTCSVGDSFDAQTCFGKTPMTDSVDCAYNLIRCLDIKNEELVFNFDTRQQYMESQIWGGVHKEDIDTVFINKRAYYENKEWCDKNFAGIKIELGDY